MSQLASVCEDYPVKLHSLSSKSQLDDYSKIAVESDRLRHLCAHLHQEMMGELAWPGKNNLETGIDVRTLGLKEKDLNVLPILARKDVMAELADWKAGKALGEYNKERLSTASSLVVMTIKGQSEADYFVGGKALQQFWLTAEQNGLVIQPISPIFIYANNKEEMEQLMKGEYMEEVKQMQEQFNALLNIQEGESPVLVLRVAYAKQPEFRSIRRLKG